MANVQLRTALHQLRRLIGPPGIASVSDADLLARFVQQRDEVAFELLVRRHERMVHNVCRRVLRDPDDAEDAFQATFLALVRKAAAIGQREALAGWLYRVAYRAALRARAGAARRSLLEPLDGTAMAGGDDPSVEVVWRELRPLLDREVNGLPEKYRLPVVLCYLESRTYEEAARELGCSRGTISIRLTRARELLRRRLTRRGLTLSAGLAAVLLTERAAGAAVPAILMNSTIEIGLLVAAGKAGTGLVSAKVTSLTQGVLHAMLLTKIKTACGVLLAVALLGAGTTALTYRALADDPRGKDPNRAQTVGAGDKPDLPSALEQPGNVDRDALWKEKARLEHDATVVSVMFSPNGKLLATGSLDGTARLWDTSSWQLVRTFKPRNGPDIHVMSVAFSPDGRFLALGAGERGKSGDVTLWDLETGKRLAAFEGHTDIVTTVAISPDGKLLASGSQDGTVRLWEVSARREMAVLPGLTETAFGLAFSPDGRFLAGAGGEVFVRKENKPGGVRLWDAASGKLRFASAVADTATSVAFSPDGRRLATGSIDKSVRVWDALTGKEILRLNGHADVVRSVAFSPDGKTLASGSFDEDVRLWETASGKVVALIKGHRRGVMSVAFSPDGRTLAIGSGAPRQSGLVTIWERAALPTAAIQTTGDRLDKLLQELLRGKRGDREVIESLYLATLARLPTNEEMQSSVNGIARQRDREKALGDLLSLLTYTKEFTANVDGLRQRADRSPR